MKHNTSSENFGFPHSILWQKKPLLLSWERPLHPLRVVLSCKRYSMILLRESLILAASQPNKLTVTIHFYNGLPSKLYLIISVLVPVESTVFISTTACSQSCTRYLVKRVLVISTWRRSILCHHQHTSRTVSFGDRRRSKKVLRLVSMRFSLPLERGC